jgi:hypothetical protein
MEKRTVTNGRNYHLVLESGHAHEYPKKTEISFSMKVNSSTPPSGRVSDMILRRYTDGVGLVQFAFGLDKDGTVYLADSNGNRLGKVGVCGEYFELSLEYDWNSRVYVVHSDDVLVGSADTALIPSNEGAIGSMIISTASTYEANYYIDNFSMTSLPND